jgi:short subunit dehydrogenase-like uncharacterized protein
METLMSKKNFDVVVYGATGFTGKLVVEYMLNQYGDDETISWAMAGRSHEKLVAVRDALGVSKDVPLLTAMTKKVSPRWSSKLSAY